MDAPLAILCLLTFVIHLIGTLAYAMRIAGVRTRRIAVSFALFNLLVLVSRTSNSFQGPFLAKRIEQHLGHADGHDLLGDFRWLLLAASAATLFGALLVPTFQRVFSRAVMHFQQHRSLPRLAWHGLARSGLAPWRDAVRLPSPAHVRRLSQPHAATTPIILMNIGATALWTVGVFASLYAGCLDPALRVTASTLSSVINGVATILMFVVIDPQLSVMTDDVVDGRLDEPAFRRTIVWLVASRFAGTLLAQALLVPSALLIAGIARAL
jgi:hypothetical protein